MEGLIPVVCPHCHHGGRVPAAYAGKSIHCKSCDTHFLVPGHAAAPAAPPRARAAAAVSPSAPPRPAAGPPPRPTPAPVAAATFAIPSDDDIALAPLTDDEEKHARERYEARVLSKDRGEQSHDPDIEAEKEHERRRAALKDALDHLPSARPGGGH